MTEDWKRERLRKTIQQEKSDYQPHDELYLARAAIARVRELHHSKLDRHPQGDVQRCIACLDLWPCPTIRAIDLIGQRPGWDQDAYDLLTGPWRSVIGPVHPDDGDSDD